MGKILSQEQIDKYNHDGYLAVREVFTQDEVKELQEITDEFTYKSRLLTESNEDFDIDLKAGHSENNPKLRRIMSPHEKHPAYDKAMRNPKLLDVIEQLIGPNIRHHHTKLNNKAPGGGAQVEWHTDWGFYPHTNDDILEVGVAIDPMTIENGSLMVVPGSHKGPAYDHHENGVFVGAVNIKEVDMDSASSIVLNEGDVSLHHVRALHGSKPNNSNHSRRLLLMGYSAVDAFPISGYGDWNVWESNILRGESTNIPRFNNAPIRVGQPTPENAGTIFQLQEKLSKSHFEAD